MVSASFVTTVCLICGVLNCSFIGYSLLVLLEGQERAPNGFIFRFVYIVVSGMSLCADIMLYTAISNGTKIIKKMRVALCVKLFVIVMDFFTQPMHHYNCCQDCMRAWSPKKLKWQDYLKGDPPRDDVLTAIVSILFSLVSTTVVTIVKGVVLYHIHDFYEGGQAARNDGHPGPSGRR
ncbi:hypothetical protein MTO96_005927 [Rhipicephalus appendiculatus]